MSDLFPTKEIEVLGSDPNGPLQPRVLFAGDDYVGQPYVAVTESSISIVGRLNTGILVDQVVGTTIQGKTGIFTMPENISFGGGYWKLNPLLISCIGSSAAMPMPVLLPSTPSILNAARDLRTSIHNIENLDKGV